MHDRDALLRAIIENPEDDAPRLVYADWLDEHGEPARAEFIRLQCELGQVELGPPGSNTRYDELSDRCRDFLVTQERRWVAADLGMLPPNRQSYFVYRRGLIHESTCTVKYFVTHGDRLLDAAPIEVIGFRRLTTANVRPLAACPWSGRVRGVRLHFLEASGPAIRALLDAWPFAMARTLDLSSNYIDRVSSEWHNRWSDVAVAVAGSPCLRQMRRLSLAACGIGDVGGRVLANSPHLGEQTVLDLKDNPMSKAVRQRLRERFGRRVFLDYADHAGWRVRDLH